METAFNPYFQNSDFSSKKACSILNPSSQILIPVLHKETPLIILSFIFNAIRQSLGKVDNENEGKEQELPDEAITDGSQKPMQMSAMMIRAGQRVS